MGQSRRDLGSTRHRKVLVYTYCTITDPIGAVLFCSNVSKYRSLAVLTAAYGSEDDHRRLFVAKSSEWVPRAWASAFRILSFPTSVMDAGTLLLLVSVLLLLFYSVLVLLTDQVHQATSRLMRRLYYHAKIVVATFTPRLYYHAIFLKQTIQHQIRMCLTGMFHVCVCVHTSSNR